VSQLLTELEIDAVCWEFIARRIVQLGGSHPPQPIVRYLDALCEACQAAPCQCARIAAFAAAPPDPEPDDDSEWDELTAKATERAPGETMMEVAARLLGKTI
jgi:hypothetical protein